MSLLTQNKQAHLIHEHYLLAQSLALHAGQLAVGFFQRRDQLIIEAKDGNPQDMVSAADQEVERYLRRCVAETFPQDAVLGEEQGGEIADADFVWVVDPIDGTACFVNGMYAWCISIAVMHQGQTIIGVIYDPNAHEMFHAKQGAGAFLGAKPLQVHAGKTLCDGVLGVGTSSRVDSNALFIPFLQRVLEDGGMFMRNGSGALMIAYVAAGRLIAYFEAHMNAWDALAGILLVQEAGGMVNDFLQGNGLQQGNPVLVANSAVYQRLAEHARISS